MLLFGVHCCNSITLKGAPMMRKSILSLMILGFISPLSATEKKDDPNQNFAIGHVTISNPWTKNTAKDQKNGAVYMKLMAQEDDKFVKAEAPDIAEKIELHAHKIDDKGVAQMVAVDAIELKAKEEIMLKPRGLHVMLFGLKKPFNIGDKFPMKLTFEKAGTTEVQIEVKDQNYSCCNCAH
jgi:copper(I)-binding protein